MHRDVKALGQSIKLRWFIGAVVLRRIAAAPGNDSLSAILSRVGRLKAAGVLALVLLMPIVQLSVYSAKDSGFQSELGLSAARGGVARVPVGVLINERDNMSYASWAEQAKLGRYLASDLYTTDPHSAAYFNPYFIVVGVLSGLLGIAPSICMLLAAVLASGLFGFTVYYIGRQIGLTGPTSACATFTAVFCSGPSWVLYLLHAAVGFSAGDARPFLGVDGFYFDAFPVTIFIAYPYSAFNLAMAATSIFLVNRAVLCGGELAWRSLLPAASCCICTALIRPYDGLILCLLFPSCVVFRERYAAGFANGAFGRWRFSLFVGLLLLPVCGYIFYMSKLAVWRDFARASLFTGPTRAEIFVGFSSLWLFAACGMYRAFRERQARMLLLCAWTVAILLLAIVMGGAMARFLGGSVLASSILAVYGIEGLREIHGGGGVQGLDLPVGRQSCGEQLCDVDL